MEINKNNEIEKAFSNAIVSARMEGFSFSEDNQKLCLDVISGKKTKQDVINIILAKRGVL